MRAVFSTLAVILVVVLTWVAIDFYQNNKIKKIPSRPTTSINTNIDRVLYDLGEGYEPDFKIIASTMQYIDGRYDCSDFRLQSTTRILFDHSDKVPSSYLADIKGSVLNFKFWMDQTGDDSMCFWSENHQILFAASEYLLGHFYSDEIFLNTGLSGQEHSELGKARVLTWLEQRWLYGFTEYFSNTYYVEDIAALSNLIDFAPDEVVRLKAKMILDLLLYDLATQSFKGTFTSVSGRMYETGKKHPDRQRMIAVAGSFLDYTVGVKRIGKHLNFIYVKNYQVPQVFKEIGHDEREVIIKASNGLNISELKEKRLIGPDDNQIMMQWGMEAFTNPEVITNSLRYINKHNMLSNEFLNDFKLVNFTLLRSFGLLPLVSRLLNPKTNGAAIQRGNSYTYKTKDFFMSTLQNHQAGEFADQQHVFTVSMSPQVTVFHQHPAEALGEGALSGSPGYWVGYGRFPHSVQDENVNLSIYSIPDKRGFMEDQLFNFTHVYFPTAMFDEYAIDGKYAFARVEDTYVALIGHKELYLSQEITNPSVTSTYDLIQDGQVTYWITEVSSILRDVSFSSFINRIKSNKVSFDETDLILSYHSNNLHELTYQGNYLVNNNIMNLEYERMDSPYASTRREPDVVLIDFNGKSLYLDFYNLERREK